MMKPIRSGQLKFQSNWLKIQDWLSQSDKKSFAHLHILENVTLVWPEYPLQEEDKNGLYFLSKLLNCDSIF